MSLYITAKIVHIISAIFFISVVNFRTFIMPMLKQRFELATFQEINSLTGKKARSIIKVNNLFLIASGLYLFSLHLNHTNLLLHIKVTLGLLLALTFYIVPYIMNSQKHRPWFAMAFHYLFFSLMMIVVVLSQIMFL